MLLGFSKRAAFLLAVGLAACGETGARAPSTPPDTTTVAPVSLAALGVGIDSSRYTAELAVRGSLAYTTTWGARTFGGVLNLGNRVSIWDVSGATPALVDSLIVPSASTLGDVAVTDDGAYLVVASEYSGGSIFVYSLANPRKPAFVSRFNNADTDHGVHTAEVGRVNGTLYAFLSIDPQNGDPARIVIVDLSNPASPREVFTKVVGTPFVHDTYVRDGVLFLALWNDGIQIWDIGGGGKGGTPASPVVLGSLATVGGEAHNVWWYHDATGAKRYAFVGQEGPGTVGSSSSGDIHVVDVSNFAKPLEVAFYHVDGAGTHNFSVDEKNGILYAAYYNAGVQALNVTGNLGSCRGDQQNIALVDGLAITRCDLRLMGRQVAYGLVAQTPRAYVWGAQYLSGSLYASDMLNGIWKLQALK